MGICMGSSDEKTRAIDAQLRQEGRADGDVIKLLFLGAGGSGKSTLFKQLRLIHSKGLDDKERATFVPNIHGNLLEGFNVLIPGRFEVQSMYDGTDPAGDEKDFSQQEVANLSFRTEEAETAADKILDAAQQMSKVTPQLAEQMKIVWKDPGMAYLWQRHRSKLQVQDSLAFYMDRIDEIVKPDFLPSSQDVLHVRNRTTGIVEENFRIKNRPFLIVDVGGQRSERKKWIKCFQDVTGIIFVASLAGYDRTLYEDEDTLRMTESLKVFKDITNKNMTTFHDTAIILFLNKSDLFEEKIMHGQHIKNCFPDYEGPLLDLEESYKHIMKKFVQQNSVPERRIFVHKTCATDTKQMEHIFDAVNLTIINRALVKAGLLIQG